MRLGQGPIEIPGAGKLAESRWQGPVWVRVAVGADDPHAEGGAEFTDIELRSGSDDPFGVPDAQSMSALAPLGGSSRLSLQPLSEVLRICCETIELRLIQFFDPSRTSGDVRSLTAFAGTAARASAGRGSHAALDDPLLA